MSVSDTILGTSPGVTTSQNPLMTQQQQAALGDVIGTLMQGAKTPTQAYVPYQGQFTAPTSNLQNLSLGALEQFVMNQTAGGPGSTRAASTAMDKLIKSGGSPVDINDYFTKSVEQPMLYDFENKVLPMLQSTFSGSSAFGSDKNKQREILTNNLMKNLTSSRANMAYQSQSDALQRMLQAAGLVGQLTTADTSGLSAAMAAGAVPQQIAQQQLTAQYQDFLRGQNASQQQIQQLMSSLGQQTFQPSTAVTPGSTGLLGGMANVLTAMLAGGAGKGLMSGMGGMASGVGDWMSSLFSGGSNPITDLGTSVFGDIPIVGDLFGSSGGGFFNDILPITSSFGGGDLVSGALSLLGI